MSETEAIVAEAFVSVLKVANVDRDSDFFELGGDSFCAASLAIRLEDRLGIHVPIDLTQEVTVVRDIAAWIDVRR